MAAAIAGCGEVTSYEFRVNAVVLPATVQDALDYEQLARDSIVVERSRDVRGVAVDATTESHVTIYESNWTLDAPAAVGDDGRGADPRVLRLGAFSTPRATVLGTSMNPLADVALQDLLTHEDATAFFDRVGVTDGEDDVWIRGPTPIRDDGTALLDDRTVMESFGGVVGSNGSHTVVFAHVTRTTVDETVVVTTGVHDLRVDSPDSPYVGDGGFVSTDGFERAIDAVTEANERFALVSE